MTDLTLRAALRLYPARYRRERADEMAAVFADTTAGSGRLSTAREAFDLAAYGLRIRTGLTSSSSGGRLTALTAPLAAGASAGLAAAYHLVGHSWLHVELPDGARDVPFFLVVAAMTTLPVLGAVAALFGRWSAARVLAGGTAFAVLAHLALLAAVTAPGDGIWVAMYAFQFEGAFLLWSLVQLAAPRDALPSPAWREWCLVLVSAVAAPAVAVSIDAYASWSTIDPLWRGLMVGVPLFMALAALRRWYVVAVPGLAALPWTLSANLHGLWQQAGGIARLLPAAVLVVAAMVGLLMLRRPTGGAAPGDGDRQLV
ncbi:hypothetical protein RMN57_22195 [Kitasatospora sp. CM 4170]|uniref:Integral membrane protein n=1 Tax=Kitasatospora aburaviensis TaxID=67265 RepID=A0ABW1F3A8_9ACTN|nr:hypothetical protein [Kitasatospora sp. CM 4170]WNM47218.1 hypothetical protein RMN57_22195 [Kitasatospora sp. CM 4170]